MSYHFSEAEATSGRFPVKAVKRIANWSPELVVDCLDQSQPVILTNFIHRWPAKTWSFANLCQRLGNIQLQTGETLAQHIRSIENGSCRTTGGITAPPEMLAETEPPFSGLEISFGRARLFLGAVGRMTPLHRDMGHGLNVHIIGRKQWTFYSADQAEKLYPKPVKGAGYELSDVNLSDPDYKRHPLFHDAQPLTVTVECGEAVLVPSGWFHEVLLLEASLSVAFPVSAFNKVYAGKNLKNSKH